MRVLEAHGMVQKKGTARDLVETLGKMRGAHVDPRMAQQYGL